MEKGLEVYMLNCGKWNVIGSAGEKGFSLLFHFCI